MQLNIAPVNDLPVTGDDTFVGLPNRSIERSAVDGLLKNDADIDSADLTAMLVDRPQNGDLQLSGDGAFTYTPTVNFIGRDSFTYQLSDGVGISRTTRVDLVITETPIVISEFMAINANLLETRVRFSPTADFYPELISPDWIELQNQFDIPVSLAGMHLTDDPDLPKKWQFPEGTTIPGNGFLVVYASGIDLTDTSLDQNNRLHTNFNLNSGGEYLALGLEDGTPISEFETFPNQRPDISYGAFEGTNQFLTTPTPMSSNVVGTESAVADTSFDIDRGFFNEPISVNITTETIGATIIYTTDGSDPALDNGTIVPPPSEVDPTVATVQISETTNLRAAAFKDGLLPTNIDTHSYFFVSDLVEQRFSSRIKNNPGMERPPGRFANGTACRFAGTGWTHLATRNGRIGRTHLP